MLNPNPKKDITEPNEAIYEAQTYLRALHFDTDGDIPLVNPDGFYGDRTRDAVTRFQERQKIAVTGTIDCLTWTLLYEEYCYCSERNGKPTPLSVFPAEKGGYTVEMGEQSDVVSAVQFVLQTLAHHYDGMEGHSPTGIYDNCTADDVRAFQAVHGLPVTGIVNLTTWNELADAYNRITAAEK